MQLYMFIVYGMMISFKYRISFSDLIANFQVKCSIVICIMGEISCKCASSCSGQGLIWARMDCYKNCYKIFKYKISIFIENIKHIL